MYEQSVIALDKLIIFSHHVDKRWLALPLLISLLTHFKFNYVKAESTPAVWSDVLSATLDTDSGQTTI